MSGENSNEILEKIRTIHIDIEKILQDLSSQNSSNPCFKCTNVCCKEYICRESIDSDFLRFILGRKISDYHTNNGWMDKYTGCKLTFGRPLVCYEYFCSQFNVDTRVLNLQQLSKEFKKIYARIYRNQHILEIDDINLIPEHRLIKLLQKLKDFKVKANKNVAQEKRSLAPFINFL